MGTILFSLIIATCPANAPDISAKYCHMAYDSGGYSASDCVIAQGEYMGRMFQKKLLGDIGNVALCWQEHTIPVSGLTKDEIELN